MKIKQFFIDNKDFLKKLFQFLLCLLGVLFYTISIFACGYNVKTALDDSNKKELDSEDKINLVENKQNINEENIVKVLHDKKNVRDMDIQTTGSVFPVGLVRAGDGLDVELYVNVESSLYTYYYESYKEIELELTFNTYAIAYDVTFNKITSTIKSNYYTFLVDIALGVEIDRYFIGVEYFEAIYEDYVDVEGGSVVIDLYHTYDFFYVLQDRNGNQVDGYSKTIEYNGLTFETNNPTDWSDKLFYNFNNGYQTRYNPSSILIPNNYQNGYNDGYNAGVSGNIGYENGYNAGYSEGYFNGTLDTEKYYEDEVIPELEKIEYQNGYDSGYDVGYDLGKDVGYEEGFTEGKSQNNAILKPFELIVKGVEPVIVVLSSEIAPGITIGTIALIPLAVTMIVFLLKGLVL